MSVDNLQSQTLYKIIDIKEVETKFGKTHILTDENLDEYWANKKISQFIKTNKITSSNNGKVLFTIKTGEYKTFENQNGDKIKFLNLICTTGGLSRKA